MNLVRTVFKWIIAPYRPNKSRTVRFAFPLLFVVSAFLGANIIDSSTESYIHIESSKNTVRAGELFKIDVYVSAHVPVNAVDITLTFPKTQVEITGIDVGQSVITLWTTDPYVKDSTVILSGGTFRKGFKGDHLIATINARAKESGLASFNVSNILLLAGDGFGSEVMVTDSGEDSTQLIIAKEDGTYSVSSSEQGSSLEGTITLRIVTDIDGDGNVTLKDLSRFMSAWSSRIEIFDFNGDGRMTFRDFGIILSDVFFK